MVTYLRVWQKVAILDHEEVLPEGPIGEKVWQK